MIQRAMKEKSPKVSSWEPSLDRVVTIEQIVDKVKKQIFKAGTLNLVVLDKEVEGTPIEETVQGVDALDVELILQLFGLAE